MKNESLLQITAINEENKRKKRRAYLMWYGILFNQLDYLPGNNLFIEGVSSTRSLVKLSDSKFDSDSHKKEIRQAEVLTIT